MATYEQLNRLTKVDLKLYEGQLRLRAPRLSEALGYDQYNDVRHIIQRRRTELERPSYGGTLVQIAQKSTGGRPASIDLLTVTQAMLVAMFSDASNAPDVREQIILAANAWYQEHPASLPFFNALMVPEPHKTEGNVTWLPSQNDLFEQPADDEDADDTTARHLWTQSETSQDDLPLFKRNAWIWIEKDGDAICMITQRNYPEGEPMMLRFVSDTAPTSTRLSVFEPSGRRLLICVDHVVPLALVERAYARLGRGPMAEITLNTLRHYLAL